MRILFLLLLTGISWGVQATEKTIPMQQQFGPARAFSVMVPTDWIVGTGESFSVNAPNGGASLGGTAYRIEHRPSLSEFSNARYQGVDNMGVYTQVGLERALANGDGVMREYEGVWPGDAFTTTYIVACKSKEAIYACLSLVTTKTDFTANRVFYEKMFSTFAIHP